MKIELDALGFPMVQIGSSEVYLQWCPFTKIQMEHFLSRTTEPVYNADWYNTMLGYSTARISPQDIKQNNYAGCFATGILPKEVHDIATALRAFPQEKLFEYTLPTISQWKRIYDEFSTRPEIDIQEILQLTGLSNRTVTLLKNLNTYRAQTGSLAGQMLMSGGVMEYVQDERRGTYAGYGRAGGGLNAGLIGPESGGPQRLVNQTEGARMQQYGFRLLARMAAS